MSTKTDEENKALEHVARAQEALSTGDTNIAQNHMEEALSLAPKHPQVLTSFGGMLADVGNTEKALVALMQAVKLEPDVGFEKYMYIGQLLGATDEAEQAFCSGIEILKDNIEALDGGASQEEAAELASSLSSAMCSLAELRMTRAEEIEDVSHGCTELLEQATQIAPSSPEPLQALASLHYELGDPDKALLLLRASMEKWWQPSPRNGEVRADAEAMEPVDHGACEVSDEAHPDTAQTQQACPAGALVAEGTTAEPSYEFRVECCKLLLELDNSTDAVVQILESLLCEQDEVPQTWHLLALAHYAGGDFIEADESLQYGLKVMKRLDANHDEDLMNMFSELQYRIEEAKVSKAAEDEHL